MSDKMYTFQFDGQEFRIDATQKAIIQQLKDSIVAVANGTTAALGLVEVNTSDLTRASYYSPDTRRLDSLIDYLEYFRKYLQREAVMVQGNAPPTNRSLTTQ